MNNQEIIKHLMDIKKEYYLQPDEQIAIAGCIVKLSNCNIGYEKGLVAGYRMALQDLNIIGKDK